MSKGDLKMNVKEKFSNVSFRTKKIIAGVGVGSVITAVSTVSAFANEGSGGTVNSSLTGALTTTANDAMATVNAVLPIVLPIMGAIVAILIGVRLFKKLAK